MTEYKIYYIVTMDGRIEDFQSLREALEYIKKKWNDNTFHASIKIVKHRIEEK